MDETIRRVAVLYADVSGSTKLYEKFGDKIARADIHVCLDLLTNVAAHWDGRVLMTIGDEVMCQFPNAFKAANAAIEMQEELAAAGEQGKFQSGPLRIKIGWHYGTVEWRKGDLVGEAPIIAQQVIKLAKANEVLTTSQSIAMLPPEMREQAHVIDRINSEAAELPGQVEVCVMQWEETEEVTRMGVEETKKAAAPHGTMVLMQGDQEIRLNEENPVCRIGRAPENDLCVQGRFVSRLHAEARFRNGNFHFRDLSVNGSIIEFSDGRHVSLHRDEDLLTGSGRIGFGCTPDEEPEAAVSFRAEPQH
ncbi:MAG: adenylate/guanylate cyclase domain-containing protein [Gammaproteobacteria bacterium]|nr:adenylate/guanylate cyclase domain-containing protein [Gammaproteobacteria bacterium]